jgi:hypothetical protein
MSWQIQYGEQAVRFDDLPPALFQSVAKKYGIAWYDLYLAPVSDLDAFTDLVRAAATHAEVEPPPMETIGEVVAFWTDKVTQAEDDLPQNFGEGGVPLTEGQATDSSSSSG